MRTMLVMLLVALAVDGATAAVLCRTKKGAVLARDVACKGKETQLNLADFGAVGPKGDKGDTGDTGNTGATGPSAAYQVTGGNGNTVTMTRSTIQTLNLPAGKYLISARGWVINSGADIVQCHLVASPDGTETGDFTKDFMQVSESAVGFLQAAIVLSVRHTFSAAGVVHLDCEKETANGAAGVNQPQITALLVGDLP